MKKIDTTILFLETAMIFLSMLVPYGAYYLLVNKILGGSWITHVRGVDMIDIVGGMIFATSAIVIWKYRKLNQHTTLMMIGFIVMSLVMLLIILLNRWSAIDSATVPQIGYVLAMCIHWPAAIFVSREYIKVMQSKEI